MEFLLITLFLLLIAFLDLKYRQIPNRLVYPATAVLLLYHSYRQPTAWPAILIGGGLALGIFALTAWLRPGDLGGGDIKLAALIGLFFGFPAVLWALGIGVGLGAGTAVFLLWRGQDRHTHIPYAPFLCLGAFIALLIQRL